MANLYYHEALSGDAFCVGSTVELDGDEARHAVKVARLRLGERTMIGNGRGAIGTGEVVSLDRDRFLVRFDEVAFAQVPECELVLVQALAKGDRDERAVEQATEFGVDAIHPWQAARSISRWDGPGAAEKRAKGLAKWVRIAREAAKQSMRARVPVVGETLTTAELCACAGDADVEVIVLHPRGSVRLSDWAAAHAGDAKRVLLVIGPEGGFDDAEIDRLASAGAQVLVLGDTVLRTSSAGPAAIAVLNSALGRW